jgi:hypothetical protein
MEKTWKQILKNADFKKFTKILDVTVHNFSTFWALFWALFEHVLAIFASTLLGFYQRDRERPREKVRQNTSIWLLSLFCHPKDKHLIGFAISISQRSRNEFHYTAKRNISQRNTPKSCCALLSTLSREFFRISLVVELGLKRQRIKIKFWTKNEFI